MSTRFDICLPGCQIGKFLYLTIILGEANRRETCQNDEENGLQKQHHEHGQGKREGGQIKGNSDKRITESRARQKEALHSAQI
jgi:hypothetical protein